LHKLFSSARKTQWWHEGEMIWNFAWRFWRFADSSHGAVPSIHSRCDKVILVRGCWQYWLQQPTCFFLSPSLPTCGPPNQRLLHICGQEVLRNDTTGSCGLHCPAYIGKMCKDFAINLSLQNAHLLQHSILPTTTFVWPDGSLNPLSTISGNAQGAMAARLFPSPFPLHL